MAVIFTQLNKIEEHLRNVSRFTLPDDLKSFIEKICNFYISNPIQLKENETIYRARINSLEQKDSPYPMKAMEAPPAGKAGNGRLNPKGISYLYAARKVETAIAETRPWKGANISIASISPKRKLKLVNLTKVCKAKNLQSFKGQDVVDGVNSFISEAARMKFFSSPAHPDDEHSYIVSQYIVDMFRNEGFDGVLYESVLYEEGQNICIFDATQVSFSSTVEVHTVKGIEYTCSKT
ncbi:TPA: RES family NAD+ phosphorylase [Vibrio diabolicus]|uniref:RES family NAD+ phosphorylase n=1 Tax=Vibrio diabolicus TaxID=50719 RepID=UPI0040684E4E